MSRVMKETCDVLYNYTVGIEILYLFTAGKGKV